MRIGIQPFYTAKTVRNFELQPHICRITGRIEIYGILQNKACLLRTVGVDVVSAVAAVNCNGDGLLITRRSGG